MDGSDLQKWPELTNYCNSYDIGLRLTGTYIRSDTIKPKQF